MILYKYIIRQIIPIFIGALLFFVLLLSLIDLFANLWKYLTYEAPFRSIGMVMLLYIPKCISYALPISLLFSIAYAFGDLYSKNELTIIFTSGIPLWKVSVPVIVLGIGLSVFSFFFEDMIVLPTLKAKKALSRTILHQQTSGSNSEVVVKTEEGRLVYLVDFYNDEEKSLNGIIIIERKSDGNLASIIRSRKALWNGSEWLLENPLMYHWNGDVYVASNIQDSLHFSEQPDTFRRSTIDVEELSAIQAQLYIQDLKRAGLPIISALTDLYKRYAFALTPLIVILLSLSLGGFFKKNVLLMSLLSSLISAVLFYVAQMLFTMLAKLSYISPFAGAWSPVFMFLLFGIIMIRFART
ncbi:LptF/LptG family permease [Gracilinema caldarium]|uniref:Permease YjgP/YjgQ family protein n=1 Tax=Gracilinema caldarium (strain ATCC 51460 / DSM 7334 / H1) TaxID=744872 RepID=F8F3D1_GRAC1|nr:LptF/LptG family permease [Gracilinema caldarium]AEJ19507.1 permease YjgP/YjgQ family protein [Gracilinema caldarium DSM 7334]